MVERWLNQLRYRVTSPQFIISVLLFVVLAYMILVPLYELVGRTMTWEESDIRISREAAPGEFMLYHWKNVLLGISAKAFFIEHFVHTLITGLVAAVVAVLLGGLLSWLITRTTCPGDAGFGLCSLFPI